MAYIVCVIFGLYDRMDKTNEQVGHAAYARLSEPGIPTNSFQNMFQNMVRELIHNMELEANRDYPDMRIAVISHSITEL